MRRQEVEQALARARLVRRVAAVGAVGTMILLVIVGASYGLGFYVAATSGNNARQVTPTVADTPTPTPPPAPASSPWRVVWQRAGTAPAKVGGRGVNLTPPPLSTIDTALAPGQHVLLAWSCNAVAGLPPAATFLQVSITQNGKSLPVESRVCPGYSNVTLTAAATDAADLTFGTLARDAPWSVTLQLPAGTPWGFAVEVPNR